MPSELTTTARVRISDCDARGRWRPSAILVELQELAEVHAAQFDLPRTTLLAHGMAWILYRQRIVMHTYPTFGDDIRITTWPSAIDGPIFPRHFLLSYADGTPVGEVSTSWILMDIQTRRPLRPSALPGKVTPSADREAPMPLPGMLRIENAAPVLERVVQYSDLDVNGHMNNTRYIDWVCDAMQLDALLARGLAQWQINYISEGRPGETLSLFAAHDGDTLLVQGKRATDGRPVFDASVTLNPIG